MENPQSRSIY